MKSLIPWRRAMRLSNTLPHEYPSLIDLREEMTRLFGQEFGDRPMFERMFVEEPLGDFMPKLDMKETSGEVIVSVELPGMHEDQIEIFLVDGVLTLKGEKIEESKMEVKGHYRMERKFGKFERMIPMPCEIDTSRVEAFFNQGVLMVILPKLAFSKSDERKIAIKTMA